MVLGGLGAVLGRSWGVLGCPGAVLGRSCACLGASWGSWGGLWAVLGSLGAILKDLGVLGRTRGVLPRFPTPCACEFTSGAAAGGALLPPNLSPISTQGVLKHLQSCRSVLPGIHLPPAPSRALLPQTPLLYRPKGSANTSNHAEACSLESVNRGAARRAPSLKLPTSDFSHARTRSFRHPPTAPQRKEPPPSNRSRQQVTVTAQLSTQANRTRQQVTVTAQIAL